MATSGTTNFTLQVHQAVLDAYEMLGGEYISAKDAEQAQRVLNLIFRDLENRGAPIAQLDLVQTTVQSSVATVSLGNDAIDVIYAVIDRDGIDYPLERQTLLEYEQITNKTQTSRPTTYFPKRNVDNIQINLWPVPENSTDILRYYVVRRIDDVTQSGTQTMDVNDRLLPAIQFGLAYYLSFRRQGIDPTYRQELGMQYEAHLKRFYDQDSDKGHLVIEPWGYFSY